MQNTYTFEEYINKINEGLIKTYDIDKTYDDMHHHISLMNIKYSMVKNNNNKIILTIDDLYITKNMELMLDIILGYFFNLYGWFPSSMENTILNGMSRKQKFRKEELLLPNILKTVITFESKFDIETTNIPTKMYHISIEQYEKDILQKGILPKSKSKLTSHDYDGRIYLCDNITACIQLINSMKMYYSSEKDSIIYNSKNPNKIYNKNTRWIIFEIDTDKAGIKTIYKDPNYINGYYYLGIISKKSINIIQREI